MKRRNFLKLFGASLMLSPPALLGMVEKDEIKLDKSQRLWASFRFLFSTKLHGKHLIWVINTDQTKNRTYDWTSAPLMEIGVEPDEIVVIKTESGLTWGLDLEPTVMKNGTPRWKHVDIRTKLDDDGFALVTHHRQPMEYGEG